MRWLINYIRSCFCKHDWECLLNNAPVYDKLLSSNIPHTRVWLYRCTKCGVKNKITTE